MDIDTLSAELSHELMFESIEKSLPPKLAYRFQAWMRRMRRRPIVQQMGIGKFEQIVTDKMKEIKSHQSLAKNEALASFYDTGIVKMDFGSDIDPKIKEAAIKWAKRRGLKVAEASLAKSEAGITSYTFATEYVGNEGSCLKQIKWTY